MLRTSLIVPTACVLLVRQSPCSCVQEEPCEYEVTELAPDAETPWGTTAAEDIAMLEMPAHGTWTWGESSESLDIEHSGEVLPAWASFVHDPDTLRYSEKIAGWGVGCFGQSVYVDGTLTITDEEGAAIVSVPVTAERHHQAGPPYFSMPHDLSLSELSSEIHAKGEFDRTRLSGLVLWAEGSAICPAGLCAHFSYISETKVDEHTTAGSSTRVGEFEPDV